MILLCQYVFGIVYVSLGNLATDIYRGAGIKRDEVTAKGIPCVRYGEIYTMYDISFHECVSHMSEDVVAKPKYFEHGDIIFTIAGESVEEIGKSIAYLGNEKFLLVFRQRLKRERSNMNTIVISCCHSRERIYDEKRRMFRTF